MALGFRPRYAPDVAVSSSLSATGVRWDLRDLEPDAEQATREWDELLARARDFAERRRGTVGSAGGPVRSLTRGVGGEAANPAWSPGGKLIAYDYRRPGFSSREIWFSVASSPMRRSCCLRHPSPLFDSPGICKSSCLAGWPLKESKRPP